MRMIKVFKIAQLAPWPAATRGKQACADASVDPRIFDETLPQGLDMPAKVCAGCAARPDCRLIAEIRRESGVWGGRLFDNGLDVTPDEEGLDSPDEQGQFAA